MRPVIEKYLPDFENIKEIRKSLKQVKDEWLETKPGKGNNKYMGVNTVRQILDHAVTGYTYWDFGLTDQWRQEVYKFDKGSNQWTFDGYVYHVKGFLFIPGLGQREQYGCKVAIGGKDNQDSAYKSAASNCLVKCASMFGVGEELYSKIKVDMDDEEQYQQMQQDPNVQLQQQPQQQLNSWTQQHGYPDQQQQWGQQSQQSQQQAQWGSQQQNWNQQNNWDNNQQNAAIEYRQQQQKQQWNQQPQQGFHQQEQQQGPFAQPALGENDFPFNPHEPGTPAAQAWDQQNMPPAQEQSYQAQPQKEAQAHNYQAQSNPSFGAPVEQQAQQAQKEPEPSSVPQTWDMAEMQRTHAHKARLNIANNEQLNQYVRDFLKNEIATIDNLKAEQLKGFNDYLEKFSA